MKICITSSWLCMKIILLTSVPLALISFTLHEGGPSGICGIIIQTQGTYTFPSPHFVLMSSDAFPNIQLLYFLSYHKSVMTNAVLPNKWWCHLDISGGMLPVWNALALASGFLKRSRYANLHISSFPDSTFIFTFSSTVNTQDSTT